jgi:hypothetical protein
LPTNFVKGLVAKKALAWALLIGKVTLIVSPIPRTLLLSAEDDVLTVWIPEEARPTRLIVSPVAL